jgi:hypothetical protein
METPTSRALVMAGKVTAWLRSGTVNKALAFAPQRSKATEYDTSGNNNDHFMRQRSCTRYNSIFLESDTLADTVVIL